jgi:Zn ribbon nucleic-acid-binding protein
MHITMVKRRLIDGSECRKCAEAADHLKSRGLWDRIDEIVWALELSPNHDLCGCIARV